MHKLLFLGYSNLIKARIIPILDRLAISDYSIAKYEGQDWDNNDCLKGRLLFDNFEDALQSFDGDLVYVSMVNSAHYTYGKKALERGYNVIIDKPATPTFEEANELVNIAKSKDLLVCESTVYLSHPQFAVIEKIYKDNKDSPKLLTVHFTMPPFLPNNFRYRKELGGGAIMDTVSYAISISRHFFKDFPTSVSMNINETNEDGLDIEYSLMMNFPSGKSMVGHLGFNTEYLNQIHILGNRTNITLDRVFTIPENLENTLAVAHMNKRSVVKVPCGNNFELYLKDVLESLNNHDYRRYYSAMLYDAKVKSLIINNVNSK